jgi:SurA N-terminal domain
MRHRALFFIQIMFLAVCLGVETAQAGANSQAVAVVLSQPIGVSEIEPRPDEVARQKASLDAEAFTRWLDQARAKQLAALVQKRLMDSYAKQLGLEPTEAELRPLLLSLEKTSKKTEESMRQVRQRRLAEIRKKLEAPSLDPAERARLTADLADWERFPSGHEARAREGDRQFMSALVQNWKVQRSLYKRHGGRVLYSSFGFNVAIDALKQFLREEEERGSFKVFNPGLRTAFWTAVADETWADGVTTGRGAEEMFATPPWQVKDGRP